MHPSKMAMIVESLLKLFPAMIFKGPISVLGICIVVLIFNIAFLHDAAIFVIPPSSVTDSLETEPQQQEPLINKQQNIDDYVINKAVGRSSNEKSELLKEALEKQLRGTTTTTQHSTGKDSNGQLTEDQTISACLLIKDDNDLLGEWLAYHYHVLNMRYLVVAVDPSSETSPKHILDRWTKLVPDFNVTLWSDDDFMPKSFLEKGYHIHPNELNTDAKKSQWHEGHEDPEKVKADLLRITNHRYRQITFISKCFQHIRNNYNNKRWVMHIDTDEFVVINPILRKPTIANKLIPHINVQSTTEKSSIFNVLQQVDTSKLLRQRANYPCISMPRLLFGSVEDSNYNNNNTNNTNSANNNMNFTNSSLFNNNFKINKFETLRWKYHTSLDDSDRNAQPKVIIDIKAVNKNDRMFSDKPFSIHRPSMRLCRRVDQLDFTQPHRFPITINHYTGSWERYNAKNDSRRSQRTYNFKANVSDGYDDWITPWIYGFINDIGHDKAKELLQEYSSNTKNSSITTPM